MKNKKWQNKQHKKKKSKYRGKKRKKGRIQVSNQQFHLKVNSVKDKRSKQDKVQKNQKIINMQIKQNGLIKHIIILDSKKRAVKEFLTAIADKQNSTQNSNQSYNNENEEFQNLNSLKIRISTKRVKTYKNDQFNQQKLKQKNLINQRICPLTPIIQIKLQIYYLEKRYLQSLMIEQYQQQCQRIQQKEKSTLKSLQKNG
ncbi:hypothetical protein TTHERM_00361550 (macronuclear) [Tetrahymena thermophila SB210]|uniref:Uncharacterized protein n=1 Tax=Tetrahymena thermophila (strain SB210) TaxID=312017 RepID=Q22PI9_TETTS|nr:hypothetical protein TTHERM_00361550 [Tetrahymena thermophila SB210]EAR87120.2 hypothetical protein TTHERM_00361550 [Tetrahymena thermophila SB210]|eukprot:XP_001007365.2 hypothetical protein TTHERM_00361550 [Tetrahymena thermophila SB210]